MIRGNLDELYFIDPLGRDLDPQRDRTVPEGATLYLRGWAYFTDPERAAAGIVAAIDDGPRFDLSYNQNRPDVALALGLTSVSVIGFHGMWSLARLERGAHALHLFALDPLSGEAVEIDGGHPFEIVAGSYAFAPQRKLENAMALTFDYLKDATAEDETPAAPPLRVARGRTVLAHGWAIDLVHRTAASDVYALIDGTTYVRGIVGWRREDAAQSVGVEEAWRCGYIVRIPTTDLAVGTHRIEIRAVSADGAGYDSPENDLPLEVV